jgi:hypothetical protein
VPETALFDAKKFTIFFPEDIPIKMAVSSIRSGHRNIYQSSSNEATDTLD